MGYTQDESNLFVIPSEEWIYYPVFGITNLKTGGYAEVSNTTRRLACKFIGWPYEDCDVVSVGHSQSYKRVFKRRD